VKISGENKITLSSKKPVPVEMPYVRCQLWLSARGFGPALFLRRIARAHSLQRRQSKPLFRQASFDEPQFNRTQAGI
jgi:hypothetical protein